MLECHVALFIIEIQFFPSLINGSKRGSYVEVIYMSQTTLTQNARPVLILSTTHLSLMLLPYQLLEYLQPLTKTILIISQRTPEIS